MIFCARRFTAKEAVEVGLINKCVPQKDLLKETLKWCTTMKGHSALTIRMTKRSLNSASDALYASWQQGMELLAHVWGSPEANEGMDAFLEGRKAELSHQFRSARQKRTLHGLSRRPREESQRTAATHAEEKEVSVLVKVSGERSASNMTC